MNVSRPQVGYYACSLSSLCGAALLFLVGWGRRNPCSPVMAAAAAAAAATGAGGGGSLGAAAVPCACTAAAAANMTMTPVARTLTRLPKSQSLHIPLNRTEIQQQHHPATLLVPHQIHAAHIPAPFQRSSFYGCMPQHYREQQQMGEGL